MKKVFALMVCCVLVLFSACDSSGSSDPDPTETLYSITIDDASTYTDTALAEQYEFSVSWEIDDSVWSSDKDYQLAAYFAGTGDSLVEVYVLAITERTGDDMVSVTLDSGIVGQLAEPYTFVIQLQDVSTTPNEVLASSAGLSFDAGAHTGEYTGDLHYYATDSHNEILLTLVQYGDKIAGVMTGADNPGDITVDITATVSGTGINMDLDGLGAIEGVTGTTMYTGAAESFGGALRISCEDYYLQGETDARGSFWVTRMGTATVTGTVHIPAATATDIHAQLDGKDCSIYLMFDFDLGEDGGVCFTEFVWDGNDSMTYTVENVPAGEFAVVFLSDCNDDGDDGPVSGDCFGIGGSTAAQAGELLAAWGTGDPLPDYQEITVEEGATVAAGDVELYLIP